MNNIILLEEHKSKRETPNLYEKVFNINIDSNDFYFWRNFCLYSLKCIMYSIEKENNIPVIDKISLNLAKNSFINIFKIIKDKNNILSLNYIDAYFLWLHFELHSKSKLINEKVLSNKYGIMLIEKIVELISIEKFTTLITNFIINYDNKNKIIKIKKDT